MPALAEEAIGASVFIMRVCAVLISVQDVKSETYLPHDNDDRGRWPALAQARDVLVIVFSL